MPGVEYVSESLTRGTRAAGRSHAPHPGNNTGVTENPRIAELRRRVEADPASIAFAQLAEEYRREGEYAQAVHVCRAGLTQYPSYLSARVTLGRALAGLARLDEAREELERVLHVAPDNVAAKKALAEIGAGSAPRPASGPDQDPALGRLESWLDAILRDRAARVSGNARR